MPGGVRYLCEEVQYYTVHYYTRGLVHILVECYRIGIECYKYYYYYYTLECEEVWRGRGAVHFVFFFFLCVGIVGVDKFGVDRWIQCLGGPPATLARGRVTHFSLVVSGTVGMASVFV